jgi:flavin reductase (DIM6/NTAB) family NADH-FMN oxidoreductase RutF
MALEKEKLAQALDTLRSGLFVVTSANNGEQAGCTAVWVSRVSFNPPLLAVTLSPTRHTCKVIEDSKQFAINVLGESQLDLARRFGFNTGPDSKKFEGQVIRMVEGGLPVLEGCAAYFVCRVSQVFNVGDHKLFIGEVAEASMGSGERPAVYSAETFYGEGGQAAGGAGGII